MKEKLMKKETCSSIEVEIPVVSGEPFFGNPSNEITIENDHNDYLKIELGHLALDREKFEFYKKQFYIEKSALFIFAWTALFMFFMRRNK